MAPLFCLAFFILCLAGLLSSPSSRPASAAASLGTVNFQMRLLTGPGAVVADGNYNVEFKIFDQANSTGSSQGSCSGDAHCLWVETRTSGNVVRVVNGYMSVALGSVTAFGSTIKWDQPMWLGVRIGGTGSPSWEAIEMTSDGTATGNKITLTAVPYAFRASVLALSTSGNTGTLSFGSLTNNPVLTLPNETGTVCTNLGTGVCSGTWIQNQNSAQQTSSNFWISGAGRADTSVLSPLFDATAASGTVAFGNSNAATLNFANNNVTHTIHFADGGTSTDQNITIGSAGTNNGNLLIRVGTGSLQLQGQGGSTIGIGNNTANQTIQIGNTTSSTGITEQVGTGNYSLDGVAGSTYTLGASTTTGTFTVGGTGETGAITLGQYNGASSSTINIGNNAGATSTQVINLGASATSGSINTVTIGSTSSSSTTNIQAGSGNVNVTGNTNITGGVIITKAGTHALQLQTTTANILNIDSSVDAVNIVTNGSMEGGSQTGWSNLDNGTRSADNTHAYLGTSSLKIVTTANGGAKFNLTTGTLPSTTTFTLTVYAQASGSSFSTFEIGRSENGGTGANELSCLTAQTVVTGGWTRFSCTFTTGTTSGTPFIYARQTDATGRTFYIDAIKLEQAASATPYREAATTFNTTLNGEATFINTTDSTTAFQIQNAASTSNLFIANTLNSRIAINQATAAYTLDVNGDINTTGLYRVSGVQIASSNLSDASNLAYLNAANAFTNTNSIKVGSATAFQIQNASNNEIFTADTSGNQVVLGKASTLDGKVVFKSASNTGSISIIPANPSTSNYTLTLPAETGTLCSTGSVCTGYAAAGSGNFLVQAPTSNTAGAANANVISPTVASVTGLTVNGTSSGTGATSEIINQAGATNDVLAVNSTGGAGTQVNGIVYTRAGTGTTTNGIAIAQTGGTLTNGLVFSGTIGTDILGSGKAVNITAQGTSIWQTTTGNLTVQATAASSSLTLDSGSSGTVALGNANATTISIATNAAAHTINIGNSSSGDNDIAIGSANSGSTTTIEGGTAAGSIAIGNGTTAHNIAIGNGGTSAQVVAIGSTSGASGLTEQVGTGNYSLDGVAGSTYTLGASTTTGTFTVGGTGTTGAITLGQYNGASSSTINIGNNAGATSTQVINLGASATSGSINTVTIGSTSSSSATTLQGGTGGINLTPSGSSNTGVLVNASNNSTAAFLIQNTSSKSVFATDTTNGQIILGNSGASGVTGTIKFNFTGQTGSISLAPLTPASTAYTLNLRPENGTLCSTGSVCTGYAAAGSGNFLVQAPTSNTAGAANANVISPTVASVTGLTVNGTSSGTGATSEIINQAGATNDVLAVNSTGGAGTQVNGIVYTRAGTGTTTNGIAIAQTGGTLTNGLVFSGTIGTDILGSGKAVNITAQGTSIWQTTTGNLTVQATAASSSLTLDSGSSGTVALGNANATTISIATNAAAHTINIGNSSSGDNDIAIGSANSGSTTTIEGGTAAGSIAIGNGTTAHNIAIGNGGTSAQVVAIGSKRGLRLN